MHTVRRRKPKPITGVVPPSYPPCPSYPIWRPVPADADVQGFWRQAVHEGRSSPRLYRDRAHENRIGYIVEAAFREWWGLEPPAPWQEGERSPGYHVVSPIGRLTMRGANKKPWYLGAKVHDLELGLTDHFVLAWVAPLGVAFLRWAPWAYIATGEEFPSDWGGRARRQRARACLPIETLREALLQVGWTEVPA